MTNTDKLMAWYHGVWAAKRAKLGLPGNDHLPHRCTNVTLHKQVLHKTNLYNKMRFPKALQLG